MTKTDTITNAAIVNVLEFAVTYAVIGEAPQSIEEFPKNLAELVNLTRAQSQEAGGEFGFHQGFVAGAILGAVLQREPLGDHSALVREVIEKYAGQLRDYARTELQDKAEYAKRGVVPIAES